MNPKLISIRKVKLRTYQYETQREAREHQEIMELARFNTFQISDDGLRITYEEVYYDESGDMNE